MKNLNLFMHIGTVSEGRGQIIDRFSQWGLGGREKERKGVEGGGRIKH